MEIQKIEKTYGRSPQADALFDLMGKKSVHSIFLQGLLCSSAPMFFASLQGKMRRSVLFVLDDADEAGYFYHDLTQMMGQEKVFFFPSSYRRAVKYGQRDAANEILRTEVLARLSSGGPAAVLSRTVRLLLSAEKMGGRQFSPDTGGRTAPPLCGSNPEENLCRVPAGPFSL